MQALSWKKSWPWSNAGITPRSSPAFAWLSYCNWSVARCLESDSQSQEVGCSGILYIRARGLMVDVEIFARDASPPKVVHESSLEPRAIRGGVESSVFKASA